MQYPYSTRGRVSASADTLTTYIGEYQPSAPYHLVGGYVTVQKGGCEKPSLCPVTASPGPNLRFLLFILTMEM